MKKSIIPMALFSVLALGFLAAIAAENFTFNFQGRLSNLAGEPVPDGNYQMTLMIFTDSTGGTPRWSEFHPAVPVSEGYFNLSAGSLVPCSLYYAGLDDVYIAAQVGTEPPMARRMKINSTPNSGVARRVYGDLETGRGRLLLRSADGDSTFRLSSVGGLNMFQISAANPPDPWAPAIELKADAATQINSIRLSVPPDPFAPAIEIKTDAATQINSIRLSVPPDPYAPAIELKTDAAAQINSIRLSSPPDPWAPAIELKADAAAQINSIRLTMPPEPWIPAIELKTDAAAQISSIRLVVPPDPWKSAIEMSTGASGEGSFVMFNPQPEPPGSDPFFALKARSNGPDMAMYAPQVGGAALVNNNPQIRLWCDSTASRFLIQRCFDSTEGTDSIGVYLDVDESASEMRFFKGGNTNLKIATSSDGTAMSFLDDGSQYMGVEPTLWHAGGDLTMMDASGAVTLLLASNGMASIGTGNHTNILTVRQNSSTDPIADAWTTYSSRRWKTNIKPLENALDKIMRLNGVSYDWIENGKHDIGLIAEDVGQVVPEVVAYEENGVDAQSVDYARLVALLIEAMKEQQQRIEVLESKLNLHGIE